ncbi:four helix bundle protein [Roseisolibacter sp. H3M3-2]|uniref:four helix bundle protein n=1 Tax=Roseisolibacter sp. H3M3-2 TaxID=3031323 RepID=UPI0023DB376F|nr:four helix bundle protein [Roseisolibacter sp. H3M3-2]MDF1504050.1 four helix bundle protein [Roseisolibacter sp. H3M3-2]
MVGAEIEFERWVEQPPAAFASDPVWRMRAFQLACFAVHAGWSDVRCLMRVPCGRSLADQLQRALGSTAANIAEGYSRSSGADRVRLFEYALGSARESLVWYESARPWLGAEVVARRQSPVGRIVSLLLRAIPAERTRIIRRAPVAPER